MPIVVGIDLRTTTITSFAISTDRSDRLATRSLANDVRMAGSSYYIEHGSDRDARRMVDLACQAVRAVVPDVGPRVPDVPAIGITGQLHGY